MEIKLKQHTLNLVNREKLELSGVNKIITFNEVLVVIITSLGQLTIKGKNMKVNRLNVDNGDMSIEGEIDSLVYSSTNTIKKANLIKKLFK